MEEPQEQMQNHEPQTQQQPLVTFATTAPEQPQVPDAYTAIIEQQQAQINALIAQTNAQSAQITQLIQNGGQFPAQTHQQAVKNAMMNPAAFTAPMPQPQAVEFPNVYQPEDLQAAPNAAWQPPSMLDDRDYSLEGLAADIGKRDV